MEPGLYIVSSCLISLWSGSMETVLCFPIVSWATSESSLELAGFNHLLGTWQLLQSVPLPEGFHNAVCLTGAGCLLCFSKFHGYNLSLRVYDSSNRTWDVLPSVRAWCSSENPRIQMVIADASNQLSYKILLPGFIDAASRVLLAYDSTLRTWTRGTDIPLGLFADGHGDFYNESLYIPMRDYNASRSLTNFLWEPFATRVCAYDPNTKVWTELPTCVRPAERDFTSKVNAVACVGNDIFFMQSHFDKACDTNRLILLKLDSDRNQWTTESDTTVILSNAQFKNHFKCVGLRDRLCVIVTEDPSTGFIYHTTYKMWTPLPAFTSQLAGAPNGWGMRHVGGVYIGA